MGRIVALLQGEVFEARRTIAKKDEKTNVLQEKLTKSDARDKALRAELMKKDEEIKVLQAAVNAARAANTPPAYSIDLPSFDAPVEGQLHPAQHQPMTRNRVTMDDLPLLKFAAFIQSMADTLPDHAVDAEEPMAESLLGPDQYFAGLQMLRAVMGPRAVRHLRGHALRKVQLWHLELQHAINDAVYASLRETPGWTTVGEAKIVPGDFFVSHAIEEMRDVASIAKEDAVRVSTFIEWLIAKGYLYLCDRVDKDGAIYGLRVRSAKEQGRTAASVGYTARVVKENDYVFQVLDRCKGPQLIETVGAFHLHEEAFTDVSEEHRFGLNRLVSPASLKVANTSRLTLAKDLKRLHPEMEFTALKHHIHGLDSGSVMQLPLLRQMPASALLRQVYRPATLPEELKNVNQDQREAWYRQIANMEKKITSEETGLLAPNHATANSQTGTRPLPPTPSMPTGASVPHSVHSRSRLQSRPSHVPATSVNTVPLGHHRSTASARNDGLNTQGGGLRTRLTGALQQIGIGSSSADPPANARAGSAHRVRNGRMQKKPNFSLNVHGRS
ncbi:hypothetical protein LTR22_005702 [Elasticomyces elasticus]|nr:hypothetical protein LTR22_005702 [Elasticomyces elasticus]KAK4927083.1 hypothetical protein LTR49_005998 [Elasticomyces elasticus]KAK5769051.1 hypothetical protein LTS12_000765 [Elasticomyces elasticus]